MYQVIVKQKLQKTFNSLQEAHNFFCTLESKGYKMDSYLKTGSKYRIFYK